MTTYTKETALYDTGAIGTDIAEAGTKASKFLSADSSGIMVYDGSNGPQAPSTVSNGIKNVFIDDDSLDIRNGTNVTASFGDSVIIGNNAKSQISITESTLVGIVDGTKKAFEFNAEGGITEVSNINTMLERTPCTNIPTSSSQSLAITANMLDDAIASSDVRVQLFFFVNSTDTGDGWKMWGPSYVYQAFKKDGTTQQYTFDTYGYYPDNVHRYVYITYDGNNTFNVYRSSNFNFDSLGFKILYSTLDNAPTFSFGGDNNVTGGYAVAEGLRNFATGRVSHAEGRDCYAKGNYSHAEGVNTLAVGECAHSEGMRCDANGDYSHAQGLWTTASGECQTAIGKNNIEDTNEKYALIIGNGSDTTPSNALTVEWNGNVKTKGEITDGHGNVLAYKVDSSEMLDMFYITNVTPSGYRFTANQYRSLSSSGITRYEEYTPIIVQARCTNKAGLHVFNYSISGTTLNYEVINRTGSVVEDANFAFKILHIRDELIG